MEGACSLCSGWFSETTVQAWRRRKDGTGMICPCCQRISRAEEAARKRELKRAAPTSPLDGLRKKFGTLSITVLMMKLKLSYADAKHLFDKEKAHDHRRDQDVHQDTEIL